MNQSTVSAGRIRGLDTLRLAAAAWVACSHGARPPLENALPAGGFKSAIVALDNGLFNGVAAVMLFFVISGLVIHLANVGRARVDLANHYSRRLLRIAPPVIVAWTICALLGPAYQAELRDVLWSIKCEIAFYLAYPALFALFRKVGVERAFMASTVFACAAVCLNWNASYHSELALAPLLVIGLPGLLLGCILAEILNNPKQALTQPGPIWLWRLGAIALSAALKFPVTHGAVHIGYPGSHLLFAIFAFFWLEREIAWFRLHAPPRWMEAGGAMSYSLYLVHFPVIGLFVASEYAGAPLRGVFGHGAMAWFIAWGVMLATIAVATTVFYLVVEAPSHRLARFAGKWAMRRDQMRKSSTALTA